MIAAVTITCSVMLLSAVQVVRTENLVHSVFWLASVLISMAFAFVLLQAPFLAMIQVVLYTGGVITLMLFGVMLTQRDPNTDVPNPMHRQIPAGLTSLVTLGILLTGIWGTPELNGMKPSFADDFDDARAIGRMFLGEQVLAFEVLSVLLLAAMIGAIVLTRRKDP